MVDGRPEPAPTGPDRWPLVSALVATHNREHLLPKSIEAIVGQDYPGPIECIVVYDKAEPNPRHEMRTATRSVRVVRNDRTPGLAGARNAGALASTGEVLAFCDDDDIWLPEKIRLQVEHMHRTRADTLVSGIYVDRGGACVTRVPGVETLTLADLARDRNMEANPSTVVVRRQAFFDRIGTVDEEIPGSYGEDYDFLLRAAESRDIAVVRKPLVRILFHPGSFFRTDWPTIIAAIDYGLAKHAALSSDHRGLARLYGRKAFAYAALGQRREAREWALRTIGLWWRQPRSYLALLISLRLLRVNWVLRLAHAAGRGV